VDYVKEGQLELGFYSLAFVAFCLAQFFAQRDFSLENIF
jgi:hypothetical protein